MSDGRVIFAGCGPGAADLLTLRAARAIERADIVVWGRGLLAEEAVRAHARPGAEVVAWPPATMPEVIATYERAAHEGLLVVRLKSGDPMLFGKMREELEAVERLGVAWEVIPGVTAHAAAAAVLRRELSTGGDAVVLGAHAAPARLDSAVVLMVGKDGADPQRALLARGLAPDATCWIVHRVTWPGELVVRTTVGDLAEQLEDLALGALTLVLAVVDPRAVAE